MSISLAAWIDDHRDLPHNLGVSGMRGQLRTLGAAMESRSEDDPALLRDLISRTLGVEPDSVFLTHGATESNSAALTFLASRLRKSRGRTPRLRVPAPEYPPIPDVGRAVGFRVVEPGSDADAAAFSDPGNPSGRARAEVEIRALASGRAQMVVDETFREFSERRSRAASAGAGVWVLGTLTKAFGADDVRVGWVIPSPEHRAAYAGFHEMFLDQIPPGSVAAAIAILRHRRGILREARGVFLRNLAYLRQEVAEAPALDAPVWFDRGTRGLPSEDLARAAVDRGVLVCPGRFFGDTGGVRVTLTGRSFPRDLDAYLEVRERFLDGSQRPADGRSRA